MSLVHIICLLAKVPDVLITSHGLILVEAQFVGIKEYQHWSVVRCHSAMIQLIDMKLSLTWLHWRPRVVVNLASVSDLWIFHPCCSHSSFLWTHQSAKANYCEPVGPSGIIKHFIMCLLWLWLMLSLYRRCFIYFLMASFKKNIPPQYALCSH